MARKCAVTGKRALSGNSISQLKEFDEKLEDYPTKLEMVEYVKEQFEEREAAIA